MYKCWELYNKPYLTPTVLTQDVILFARTESKIPSNSVREKIYVLIPLCTISRFNGLPAFLEGSQDIYDIECEFYTEVVARGQALMFSSWLDSRDSVGAGGVVFMRIYDMSTSQQLWL